MTTTVVDGNLLNYRIGLAALSIVAEVDWLLVSSVLTGANISSLRNGKRRAVYLPENILGISIERVIESKRVQENTRTYRNNEPPRKCTGVCLRCRV